MAYDGYVLFHILSYLNSFSSLLLTQHSKHPTAKRVGGASFSQGIFIFVRYASKRLATFISDESTNITSNAMK